MTASDEWAEWDAREHDAVRADYEAEYGPEVEAEYRPPRFTDEQRAQLYRLTHELESAAYDRAAALPEPDGEAYDAAVRRLRAARTAFDDYVHGTEEG